VVERGKYAKGGKTQSKISIGDLVHIPSMNKSGVVTNIISQGKHYTVAFVDGSKYVADAKELELIHDDGDYMAKGGTMKDILSQTEKEKRFNAYYDYVDEKMIEGDEEAQEIIENYGYSVKESVLYDFIDKKMIEGDRKAENLIKMFGEKMAKGGLTEHGLRLNDTIKSGGHIGKTTVRVHNSNNGDYMVDLDKGKRTKLEYNRKTKKYEKTMAKGGNVYTPAIVVVNKSDKSQEETIYINNIKDGADLIYEIEQAVGDNYEVTEVEGIPESFLSRDNINRIDMDESEWDAVINAWDASQTNGIDFEVLGDVYSDYSPSNMSDFINENYEGYFANEEDLARHYVDMVGWDGIGNDAQQRYFDYESFGMDLSQDYSEYKGHYFRTYKKGGKIGKYNLNKYLKTKTMKKGGATKKPQMGDPSLKTNPYWSDPKHTKFSKRKRLPVIRFYSDDEAFEYGHGGEAYAKGGSMKQSQWGKYIDSGLRAKRAGKRKAPSGEYYYESRPNRSDKDPKKKLADGGMMAYGGTMKQSKWGKYIDSGLRAKRAGKRKAKSGEYYFESRPNRSDKDPKKKLAQGGNLGGFTYDIGGL